MKHKFYMNLNKGITIIVMLLLIYIYNQWQNPTAFAYVALHGMYGILWLLKSNIFPDKAWEKKVSLWFGLVSWFSLVLYWIPGWLLMSRNIHAPAWYLGLCISIYILGVFFHFTSDMQKHVMLEIRPNELITDRMMSLSRNINYFGEFLIYLSFALMPMSWVAFLPLTAFMIFYWSYNISKKEKSLALKSGFKEYKEKVKLFIPFLF
jgi:protein-S-isoprenylcysteine O-methyltransferase Ste14